MTPPEDLTPPTPRYDYCRDGREIYTRSFATIRAEAALDGLPENARTVAVRMMHASGDVDLIGDLAFHPHVVAAARGALTAGAPIFVDSHMVDAGITRARLPRDNQVICTLRDPRTKELAEAWGTTRAAAAVSLWGPRLQGAVVAIGNAPTALFHLLEMIADGGPRPAAIVGIPVGFIGSAESKTALAENPYGVPWLVVHGRRGGSALAASAVNALARPEEIL
ncbi:precorrin-8X methylmutase [Austwickia chelonae]|uniref:Precorrin-8X methylmutase n=1 Tax=Austwickia chelonae NBRC 105200 TaxID=1184607 RepID=K6VRA5_9MICO|nr:precorrin-8X methylmutase [Austwickia chelonae]GAB77890.1 precorrin-8X methylmutase [Austwickia chelonae NBRC 105200]SEV91611.1 precorrin-8X methylmutase [Austwickia chelonae]